MSLSSELHQPYISKEFLTLRHQNRHFDPIAAYDYVCRHESEPTHLDLHFIEQVKTALAENFLGLGQYQLEYIQQDDGSFKFTNSSFKDTSLIEIADRNIALMQAQNRSHQRESAEKKQVESICYFAETAANGTVLMWTSPPGNKRDYPDQCSITYIAQFTGTPQEKDKRKLNVKLFVHSLSLAGHAALVKTYDPQTTTLPDSNWFVGHIIDLGIRDHYMVVNQVVKKIHQMESKGLTNPNASIKEYLHQKIFDQAQAQVDEFGGFLSLVYQDVFKHSHYQLSQEDVNYLERAYSLGYRCVQHFMQSDVAVVRAFQMFEDLQELERARALLKFGNSEVIDEATCWYINSVYEMLRNRYGNLGIQATGGIGCPAGVLADLGFTLIGNGSALTGRVEYGFNSEPVIEIKRCVHCPFCHNTVDAQVTPSRIVCLTCGESAKLNTTN